MKKRVLGLVVAAVLVVTTVLTYNYWNREGAVVYAEEFRDGYMVKPLDIDATGVQVDSAFGFLWEDGVQPVTVQELEANMKVAPEIELAVSESEEGLVIQPVRMLDTNTVYIFEFMDTTWGFKTEADFAWWVLSQGIRRPMCRSAAESNLSSITRAQKWRIFFTIEPEVKGRFETHGRIVVFVPKELEERTVYTVTLKEGLGLSGSDKVLSEGTSFSFETESVKEEEYEPKGYVNFTSMIGEYTTSEAPAIMWDFYTYDNDYEKEAKTRVYAYNDFRKFMLDIGGVGHMPFWSRYGMMERRTDVSGLQEVMEFDYAMTDDGSYPKFLQLPDRLDPGYYLVDVEWEGMSVQTFIQVTDLSFYYSQNTNGDIFWIHDLEDGQPLEGVKVTEYVIGDPSEDYVDYSKLTVKDVKSGGSSVSDAKGIAGFIGARESDIGKTKVYHLSAAGRESICFDMPDPWFRYYGQENNYYWKYFKSDRSLYKPDDTVEFFGYLKNRYKDVDIDEVTVEIVQGGYYYFEFLPYNIDSLSYVTTEVEVDKGFFEGGFKLPNLQQGGYELVVRYKGDRVASSYISVEDYVKPSYKLEVDKDKKAVFVDEPIKFTVGSRFFEGTPVSYLDFNYNIGGVTYVDDRMQTDKKGEAVIDFRPNYVVATRDSSITISVPMPSFQRREAFG